MDLKTGYKQTEIGLIPMDWEVNTVQELIDDKFIVSHLDGNHGALYPKSYEFKENGVPYIGANDFLGGKVSFNNCKYLSNERAEEFRKGIAIDGDVLFAHNATVGPVAFLETSLNYIILSTTATYFRCDNNNLINNYLIYALQSPSFIHQYSAIMSQSTRCQVPITAQRKLNLIIPTPAEQTAIATALSDADGLITGLEKLIAKKRNIKQGAMQQLLQPKEDWEVKKLGEVAHVIMGQSPLSQFYNTESIGLPLIQGNADINNRKTIIRSYTSFVTKKGKAGDIIMSVRAPVGEISRATFNCCLGRGVCSISYENDFIYHYLIYFEKSWAKLSTGSTFDSVNSKQVKELEIPIPKSKEEQIRIATILSDMDAELSALEQKLEKYKKVKLGMMQELLTGKTRLV
jgi:type I restriction enzyme S subunit